MLEGDETHYSHLAVKLSGCNVLVAGRGFWDILSLLLDPAATEDIFAVIEHSGLSGGNC